MSTKSREAMAFLKEVTGGPLTFGEALAAVRDREGLGQAELARMAGVTRSTICDLEKGRTLPSPELAAKYARLLDHSEAQFVRLVFQDQVRKAGLRLRVSVKAA
jgi:DNA-binding XRE family transcriptional regulator